MFKSRKSLKKTVEGQAQTINEYTKRLKEKDEGFILMLQQIREINNTPTPSRNNWKLRQTLINNKIDDIIRIYKK